MKKRRQKGFTLIELLVVIAIIGILASVVMVSVGSARHKANVAKAKGDASQIMTAYEMCNSDGVSVAIPAAEKTTGGAIDCADSGTTYMQAFPADPDGTGTGWTYAVGATDTFSSYTITVAGFKTPADKFICQNGSCYCTPTGGCK